MTQNNGRAGKAEEQNYMATRTVGELIGLSIGRNALGYVLGDTLVRDTH